MKQPLVEATRRLQQQQHHLPTALAACDSDVLAARDELARFTEDVVHVMNLTEQEIGRVSPATRLLQAALTTGDAGVARARGALDEGLKSIGARMTQGAADIETVLEEVSAASDLVEAGLLSSAATLKAGAEQRVAAATEGLAAVDGARARLDETLAKALGAMRRLRDEVREASGNEREDVETLTSAIDTSLQRLDASRATFLAAASGSVTTFTARVTEALEVNVRARSDKLENDTDHFLSESVKEATCTRTDHFTEETMTYTSERVKRMMNDLAPPRKSLEGHLATYDGGPPIALLVAKAREALAKTKRPG